MRNMLNLVLFVFLLVIAAGCSDSENTQKITCSLCRGKGVYAGFFDEQCKKCTPVMTAWGSPAGVEAKCSACRGKGGREVVYRGFTGNETCQKCFGSGYVFCRACRGIRITQVHKKGTCPQCRGRKVVKVKRQGKNNAYRGSNYMQQQRARDAAEIISNHVYIPGYPGKLEEDLGRNALKPDPYTQLFDAEMFDLFSPYPTHEETLEKSTEDFNSKLERARDVYNRTGVKIDVSP